MRLRKLSDIWWRDSYPQEHLDLMAYAESQAQLGLSWQQHLSFTLKTHPNELPSGIQRLCKELGVRVFDLAPSFLLGDGVTILTEYARFPGTVVDATSRVVHVQQNQTVTDADKERNLFLQDSSAPVYQFSKRASGDWQICGSRARRPILIYGRSSTPRRHT